MDAGEVVITHNLKLALRRLRPSEPNEELIIWIDAVCINQENIPERSVQTSKMRSIYHNAEKVLVWIGPESSGSVRAISLARYLNDCKKEEVGPFLLNSFQNNHYEKLESLVSLFRRQVRTSEYKVFFPQQFTSKILR